MRCLSAVVVGSGWGAHAARALAADPRVALEAIVARGSDRSRALAHELGCRLVASIAEAGADLDLAVLAAGEREHEGLALDALGCVARGDELTIAGPSAHVLCAHPVALDAAAVGRIARAAARAGRLARTDYTFRLRPELAVLRQREGRGELLRVAIAAPGRWLPIALDTAVVIGGPVLRVTSTATYPGSLADRVSRAPHAFPPTIALEHIGGTVSSIVPFPHASPGAPVEVQASFERVRVEARLPAGGARTLRVGRGGLVEELELLSRTAGSDAAEHGRAMQAVTTSFVGAILGGPDVLATLGEEEHLRLVWSAVWRSARDGSAAVVVTK